MRTVASGGLPAIVLLVMLASAACSPQAAQPPDPTPDEITGIATVEISRDMGTVPPRPVFGIESEGKLYPGAPASYCWPQGSSGGVTREVCVDTVDWTNVEILTPAVERQALVVRIEADEAPTELTAYLFGDPAGTSIQKIELDPALEAELSMDLPPGKTLLRISGIWPEGGVDYEFELLRVPGGEGLSAECFVTEADPLPVIFVPGDEPTPTAFDGRNRATCRFSQPISRVSVTLDSDAIGVHGETYHIEPASYELTFPLPQDTPSEMTLELLPVGSYDREMIVIAEDGDQWSITENLYVALDTVSVVEKATTDRQ